MVDPNRVALHLPQQLVYLVFPHLLHLLIVLIDLPDYLLHGQLGLAIHQRCQISAVVVELLAFALLIDEVGVEVADAVLIFVYEFHQGLVVLRQFLSLQKFEQSLNSDVFVAGKQLYVLVAFF